MAFTVPAKSQLFHNFTLPHLIWKNHRSGRNRLAGETYLSSPPHQSPSTPLRESPPPTSHAHIPHLRQSSPSNVFRQTSTLNRQSPMRDSASESEPSFAVPIGKPSRRISSGKSTKSIDGSKVKRSNKICTEDLESAEEEGSVPRTWNLRPRRPMNQKQLNGGLPKVRSSPLPKNRNSHERNNHNKESSEVKNNDHGSMITSRKPKFSISLSRDEIEEDIISLTGLKPSRRPKKRPRSVQKQLDTLFPGLWLGSITTDSYKVSEPLLKG